MGKEIRGRSGKDGASETKREKVSGPGDPDPNLCIELAECACEMWQCAHLQGDAGWGAGPYQSGARLSGPEDNKVGE